MDVFDVRQVKTNLSRLVDRAARGEPFVIAKAGRPLVKVVPLEHSRGRTPHPIGFLKGRILVTDDFDRIGEKEIEAAFGLT